MVEPLFNSRNWTIYQGDAFAILPALKDQPVDMIIADPPYGADVQGGEGRIGGDNLAEAGTYPPVKGDATTETAIMAYNLCERLWPEAVKVWWGANYYANALPPSSFWYIWDKDRTGNFADAELAWCSEEGATRIIKHRWNGFLKGSEQGQRRVHPMQKPIALMRELLKRHEPALVLDPFMGSGSTLIAAQELGIRSLGIEYEASYCKMASQRLAQGSLPLGT